MRRAIVGIFILSAACTKVQVTFEAPGILRQALVAGVSELETTAELVPGGSSVALKRAEDGVTFSGFLAAEPGEYRIELVFSGLHDVAAERLFLGRWTSDQLTVTRGNSTPASFSQPLDTFGKEGDRGDVDEDGLANLEEIFAGANPILSDSDADGVNDGTDCDPADAQKSTPIAQGGSLLDCDADGFIRRDPAYGERGDDCDDGAATVNPGATDSCDDVIDSDCDPSSCPVDDTNPPVISDIRPEAGIFVGCQGTLSAVIRDDSRVNYAQVLFPDNPYSPGVDRFLTMRAPESGDRWESSPIQDAAGVDPVPEGARRIIVRGIDDHGNVGNAEGTIELAYGQPRLLSLSPENLPVNAGSVALQVESAVDHGAPRVRIYGVTRAGDGLFHGPDAVILAEGTGTSQTLTIDTTALADGDYLLFPVIEDDIGNILSPHLAGILGTAITAYYPCTTAPAVAIPTRVLSVGTAEYVPSKMRDLLPLALDAARAADPAAHLSQINGNAIHPDGRVHLESSTNYAPRWSFGFYNPGTMKWIDITWVSFAYGQVNPVVTLDSGSVSSTDPFSDVSALIDSDRAAQVYATGPGCPGVTGADDDYIQYFSVDGVDTMSMSAMGEYFRSQGAEPATRIFGCD
jgi:hypothetical protein